MYRLLPCIYGFKQFLLPVLLTLRLQQPAAVGVILGACVTILRNQGWEMIWPLNCRGQLQREAAFFRWAPLGQQLLAIVSETAGCFLQCS